MITQHHIYTDNSVDMDQIESNSIQLIVTSPPYPMVQMWDEIFSTQNPMIHDLISEGESAIVFQMMHQHLDDVWRECFRVLTPGGFLCINIGDATRTVNGKFSLFNNHTRIITACLKMGFTSLPDIIWRKQTNAPNKFMGSGMLPCGAYVTLEHEHILIFRKGNKREYKSEEEKSLRMKSAYFWEKRNIWFSDLWEIKGTKQDISTNTRERNAAYPVEIPYRLIRMFSQFGDCVLDPFLGTGSTTVAAVMTGRNSCGYDIDAEFSKFTSNRIIKLDCDKCREFINKQLNEHIKYIEEREKSGKEVKYYNKNLNCKVMTKQETEIELYYPYSIKISNNIIEIEHKLLRNTNLF